MTDDVNIIHNADFRTGRAAPQRWVWLGNARNNGWERLDDDPAGLSMRITSRKPTGVATWRQDVACKPGEFYRVDATMRCELLANDETAGAVLTIQPISRGRPKGEARVTPAIHRSDDPTVIRAIYQAPEGVKRVRISIGVTQATGTMDLGTVRFISIIEPDEICHPLAVPPPSTAVRPPRIASTVCICASDSEPRPTATRLAEYFGRSNVEVVPPQLLKQRAQDADALLLLDPTPPPIASSLVALNKLAAKHIVVISLPAFAKLAGTSLVMRRIVQHDDPIHAKIAFANHATRGFALHDTFPFALENPEDGSFAQHQFRKTKKLEAFCKKHGFVVQLLSMCSRESTSDQPIGLYKETKGGGLYVLDVDPIDTMGSSMSEPAPAMHLLLTILGRGQTGMGQFSTPVRTEVEFRDVIREMPLRHERITLHDADVPTAKVTEQLVTIGREDESFGLPLRPKPVILVRSGLISGDVESVYGALRWIKELVRAEPFPCPYISELATRFRLAWVPLVAPWQVRDGWRRSGKPPTLPTTLDVDGNELAAVIDVVSCPVHRIRVVSARNDDAFARLSTWLPQVHSKFQPGEYFALTVGDGDVFTDRSRRAWRVVTNDVHVVSDKDSFTDRIHTDALASGAQVLRIEIPGDDADFAAQSIHRIDLTATLIEQVVGMQYGLIAVNRSTTPVHMDGFAPTQPGEALIIEPDSEALKSTRARVG